MDSAAAIQWCEEENARSDYSVALEILGESWGEEQISQAMKTLSPDKKGVGDCCKNRPRDFTYLCIG